MHVANGQLIKDLNTTRILDIVKRSQPISRVELAEVTGLSFPTVSRIVKMLREKRLLLEYGRGKSRGGRRPTRLRLNPDASCIIGVDVDVPETTVALLDLDGKTKTFVTFSTNPQRGPAAFLNTLVEHIDKILVASFLDRRRILGLGIAVTGNVDVEKGLLVYSAKLGWRNVPLREMVSEETRIVTAIDGDVASMALGEHYFGSARDMSNLVWVCAGSGIGAALIEDGKMYRGAHGSAVELGHVTVVIDGPLCSCGKKGCLETMAGSRYVLLRLRETIADGRETLIRDLIEGKLDNLQVSHVFQAEKSGDKLAGEIVEEVASYIGLGIAMIANLVDPGVIILGGPVADAGGERFMEMVRKFAAQGIMPERSDRLSIRASALGEQAGAVGAASLVYKEGLKALLSVG
ncbi:MAG: ROK family protein [Actinobacteria bacterium]|nr:ROK family protein [Actinomycetota bacterium]